LPANKVEGLAKKAASDEHTIDGIVGAVRMRGAIGAAAMRVKPWRARLATRLVCCGILRLISLGLSSQPLDQFFANHSQVRGSVNPQPHAVGIDAYDGNCNSVADENPFAVLSAEHQHDSTPCSWFTWICEHL
jgi:hypothetical protein